ncbi:peptidoglycan DD-metalloendopeptidase family protein [uncultured Sphingomonas sp.]|uniref:peptidoglycan DD-metalloendopeptidase family protein n=1 Tax=uncultured Sphingomonas sp. TaxID=158754 RepID=UPI002600558C|nr:peptidoglycan DD-metalloendopeptidase family protein [uncultured Sphingomonas sp.]
MRTGLAPLALLLIAAAPKPDSEPPPVWEVKAATPAARDVAARTYVVKPGETLSHVAMRTGASEEAIARANRIDPPFSVWSGRRLKIPAGRYHTVGKGESGIAIARAYGVDWSRIATLNHLKEPYLLRAGQRLMIPSSKEVAKMTLEQRAAAFTIDIDDLVTGSEPALAEQAKPAAPTRSAARKLPPTVAVSEPARAFAGRFAWPLPGKVIGRFGQYAGGGRNDGIDIATAIGMPVRAAADGVVAFAGPLGGFGQLVLIRHGEGWLTAYGYADRVMVRRGQSVSRGDTIARAGASGSARRPQLHFEVREGRRPVDPLRLLPGQE